MYSDIIHLIIEPFEIFKQRSTSVGHITVLFLISKTKLVIYIYIYIERERERERYRRSVVRCLSSSHSARKYLLIKMKRHNPGTDLEKCIDAA